MNRDAVLAHLEALVGCDTQNPPRAIDGDSPIFAYCAGALAPGFEVRTWDHGEGHVSWYAVRGRPRVLFNVHLDTVPVGEGWASDPLALRLEEGRAYGRGTCDIKGAAALLLDLAQQGAEHLALLFTTDEEGADGCCVQRFLDAGEGERFSQVIVAEPTGARAVRGHRGFLSVKARFRGRPGHSSEARALRENANHQAARWAADLLHRAEERRAGPDDPGACLNLGLWQGGTKSNVIAGEAFLHWSARLRPGESNDEFLQVARDCLPADARVEWDVPFRGDPLPAAGRGDGEAAAFCARHEMPSAPAVDFWTEAALFSAAGLPAVVLGPGHIEQAHATDEWVAISQLEAVSGLYRRVVEHDG